MRALHEHDGSKPLCCVPRPHCEGNSHSLGPQTVIAAVLRNQKLTMAQIVALEYAAERGFEIWCSYGLFVPSGVRVVAPVEETQFRDAGFRWYYPSSFTPCEAQVLKLWSWYLPR